MTTRQIDKQALQSWIAHFERSLRAEEKHQYRNLKGQEYFFADFLLAHVDKSQLQASHAQLINRLKNIYTLYPLANVADRKAMVAESWKYLELLKSKYLAPVAPPEPATGRAGKPQGAKRQANQAAGGKAETGPSSDWRDVPVQFVKSVGPKLGERFAKVGVGTVGELLQYFPRRHLDYSTCVRIQDLRAGQLATVWGAVHQVSSFVPPGKNNLFVLKVVIRDGSGRLPISFFQRGGHYLRTQFEKRFPVGAQIILSGTVKWDNFNQSLTLESPEYEVLGDTEEEGSNQGHNLNLGRIVPIYPLTEGLNIKWVRRAIFHALEAYRAKIPDPLPSEVLQRLGLMPYAQALQTFHFPADEDQLYAARQRLVFQELFFTQLGLIFRRKLKERQQPGLSLQSAGELVGRFLEQLPFALTGAQQRVYGEILADLRRPEPMSRLVQGDVGSGKTVVAVLALLEAIEAGYQGALMAPTEILAEQHFQKIFEWLLPLNLQVELLTGSLGAKAKRAALARLASGEAALAVGTHALIQDGVDFSRLGLVVIDEQHRFGVKQRASLRDKGQQPEVLSMTATPIPRTLALTQYGDLEVSIIDELPPGRTPVATYLIKGSQRPQLWDFMRQQISEGRQCYVVFPLVEESEKLDLKAATVEYDKYCQEIFPELKVGLLHGKMKGAEKDAVMRSFAGKELDILVATTVIEVGVDVPNSTVMVIEHAERFGLAQLHQLRGRVGRGADKSYCYLVSNKLSEQAKERLQIFTKTHDGFVIAEHDLRIRGPGEFLGTRQSGLPDLVLTNLVEDAELLEMARTEALALLNHDPELLLLAHQGLKQEIYRFFRKHTHFFEA